MENEFEGLSRLFEKAGEGGAGVSRSGDETIDDVVARGADGQAVEFTEGGVKPELDAAGKPVEGADPAQGMKEGAKERESREIDCGTMPSSLGLEPLIPKVPPAFKAPRTR